MYETKPISHKPFIIHCEAAHSIPKWDLRTGIVIPDGGAVTGIGSLGEPGGLPREGILDAELAGQDIAVESQPTGAGSALSGAGHGQFSVVAFREIAMKGHTIHLAFRIAAANPGNGRLLKYLLCF